jgi:hypothetical protein
MGIGVRITTCCLKHCGASLTAAGIVIAPEVSAILPEDTADSRAGTAPGLGLVSGSMVGAHLTQRNALPHIVETMLETRTAIGWPVMRLLALCLRTVNSSRFWVTPSLRLK